MTPWQQLFQQSPEAVARLDEKRGEVLEDMKRDGFRHILDGGGKWGRKVAAAPPPKALKARVGVINIRRAGR